jgi:hypothetical protein
MHKYRVRQIQTSFKDGSPAIIIINSTVVLNITKAFRKAMEFSKSHSGDYIYIYRFSNLNQGHLLAEWSLIKNDADSSSHFWRRSK